MNQKFMYNILFRSVSETLLELSKKLNFDVESPRVA